MPRKIKGGQKCGICHLQSQCEEDARKFVDSAFSAKGLIVNYQTHFNKRHSLCLIHAKLPPKIHSGMRKDEREMAEGTVTEILVDVVKPRELAHYLAHKSLNRPIACRVQTSGFTDDNCQSEKEFAEFVDKFMRE